MNIGPGKPPYNIKMPLEWKFSWVIGVGLTILVILACSLIVHEVVMAAEELGGTDEVLLNPAGCILGKELAEGQGHNNENSSVAEKERIECKRVPCISCKEPSHRKTHKNKNNDIENKVTSKSDEDTAKNRTERITHYFRSDSTIISKNTDMNVNLSDADRKANHSLTNEADSTNMKVLNSDHEYVITIHNDEVETIV